METGVAGIPTAWVARWGSGATDLPTVPDQNSQFIPTNQSQWEWEEVSNILTSYHVADFRFKFWFQSDGGNNIYLDDINITSGPVGINEPARRRER